MPALDTLWQILTIGYSVAGDTITITITTDFPCHLFMRWSLIPPRIHKATEQRRGLSLMTDFYYCFDVYHDNEQEEAGDTTTHTFIKPDWPECMTRYFYFLGTRAGDPSPSESCIFQYHHVPSEYGPPITTDFYSDEHPEITSVDGWTFVFIPDSTWNFLRNAVGTSASDSASYSFAGYLTSAVPNTFSVIYRSMLLFDTSLIPAGSIIDSVLLGINPVRIRFLAGGAPTFAVYSSNPASNTAIKAPSTP